MLKEGAAIDKVDGIPVADTRRSYTLPATLAVAGDYAIRLSSVAEPSLSSTSGLFSVAAQPPAKRKWTVLCYFDGDCNLEGEMLDAFRQMGKLRDCDDVNYLFQIDRVPGFNTEFGNWYGTKRFRAGEKVTPEPAYALQDLGELNMGSAETLTDFINWATENYPRRQILPDPLGPRLGLGSAIKPSPPGRTAGMTSARTRPTAARRFPPAPPRMPSTRPPRKWR